MDITIKSKIVWNDGNEGEITASFKTEQEDLSPFCEWAIQESIKNVASKTGKFKLETTLEKPEPKLSSFDLLNLELQIEMTGSYVDDEVCLGIKWDFIKSLPKRIFRCM